MRRRSSTTAEDRAEAGAARDPLVPVPRKLGLSEWLLVLLLVVAAASVVFNQVVTPRTSGTTQTEATGDPGPQAALPAAYSGSLGIVMDANCSASPRICGESNVGLVAPRSVDLTSVSFGADNPSTATTVGRFRFNEFSATRALDTATAGLLTAMARGENIPTVVVVLYTRSPSTGAPTTVSKYTFTNVHLTKHQMTDGSEHAETFSLVFEQGKFEYFAAATGSKATATAPFCWNVALNAPC